MVEGGGGGERGGKEELSGTAPPLVRYRSGREKPDDPPWKAAA